MKRFSLISILPQLGLLCSFGWLLLGPAAVLAGQKDEYLTAAEIAKMRQEFDEPSPRIKLLEQFLNRRFTHLSQLKAELVPPPAASGEAARQESGKKNKKKVQGNPEEEEDADENDAAKSFFDWVYEYTSCLEEIEDNLNGFGGMNVDLKKMLKVLDSLNQNLDQQHIWFSQLSPKLKGTEKQTIADTFEVLDDVSGEVKAAIEKYKAAQELQKSKKKEQ